VNKNEGQASAAAEDPMLSRKNDRKEKPIGMEIQQSPLSLYLRFIYSKSDYRIK